MGYADDCALCGGTGRIRVHECPGRIDPEILGAVGAAMLSLDGHWPVDGGVVNQAARFMELRAIVNSEVLRWRQHYDEKARAEAEAAARKARSQRR